MLNNLSRIKKEREPFKEINEAGGNVVDQIRHTVQIMFMTKDFAL